MSDATTESVRPADKVDDNKTNDGKAVLEPSETSPKVETTADASPKPGSSNNVNGSKDAEAHDHADDETAKVSSKPATSEAANDSKVSNTNGASDKMDAANGS